MTRLRVAPGRRIVARHCEPLRPAMRAWLAAPPAMTHVLLVTIEDARGVRLVPRAVEAHVARAFCDRHAIKFPEAG